MAHNFRVSKTKIGVQLVKKLEAISFIACGQSHSLAISSLEESNEFKQALFSWGCGTFGQLGRSDLDTSQPDLVVFPEDNLKVVQVSAGPKHTLVLDSNNKIWYFGHKEGVGVTCMDQLCQFAPIRLRCS